MNSLADMPFICLDQISTNTNYHTELDYLQELYTFPIISLISVEDNEFLFHL